MTKHLILMMEVNGSLIINCKGRCISPQEKDVLYSPSTFHILFWHFWTRKHMNIRKRKRKFLYEGCSCKKRERTFVQTRIFPVIFPKESDETQVVNKWVNCSNQGTAKQVMKVKPAVARWPNVIISPPWLFYVTLCDLFSIKIDCSPRDNTTSLPALCLLK